MDYGTNTGQYRAVARWQHPPRRSEHDHGSECRYYQSYRRDRASRYRYWCRCRHRRCHDNAPASTVLDALSTTRGTILYRGASAWLGLAPGTAGYVLQSGGAGADPSWVPMAVDLTTYHLVSAATTNATVVKASPGKLYGWYISNNNASARKLAFTIQMSTPTAGASVFFTLLIPGSGGAQCPDWRSVSTSPRALLSRQ